MSTKILYMNEDHNFVKPEEAVWKVVHIYDDKGELIEEVWVDLKS